MAVLESFQQGARRHSGACGTHQYFTAALAPTEEQIIATLIVKTEKYSKSVVSRR